LLSPASAALAPRAAGHRTRSSASTTSMATSESFALDYSVNAVNG
jgi:hypothetical protein